MRFRGTCYLATSTLAGNPRITPVSVIIDEESIFVSLIPSTPKCREILENPRYHLHALPGKSGEEFSVRGIAALVDDPERVRAITDAHAVSGVIHKSEDLIFELLLESAHYADFRHEGGSLSAHRDRWQVEKRNTTEEES